MLFGGGLTSLPLTTLPLAVIISTGGEGGESEGDWLARRGKRRLIEFNNYRFIQMVELALPHLVQAYRNRRLH